MKLHPQAAKARRLRNVLLLTVIVSLESVCWMCPTSRTNAETCYMTIVY